MNLEMRQRLGCQMPDRTTCIVPSEWYRQSTTSFGFTLIELVVVMSIGSVLIALLGVWLQQMLLFTLDVHQRQRNHLNLQRLAVDFRQDVRFSNGLAVLSETEIQLPRSAGNSILYRINNTSRSCSIESETWADDELIQRDVYQLSDQCEGKFDLSEAPNWIALKILRRSSVELPVPGHDPSPVPAEQPTSRPAKSPPNFVGQLSSQQSMQPVEIHVRVAPGRWPGVSLQRRPIESLTNEAEVTDG